MAINCPNIYTHTQALRNRDRNGALWMRDPGLIPSRLESSKGMYSTDSYRQTID